MTRSLVWGALVAMVGLCGRPTLAQDAGLRDRYEAKEKEAAAIAKEISDAAEPSDEQRAKLRQAVAEAFALRQQLHAAELAAFRERMDRVERTIRDRERNKAEIINRRIEELLNPDLAREGGAPKQAGDAAGEIRDDNGLAFKLVWCPPGKFLMGSPVPEAGRREDENQVEVTLSQGFWLGQTEVTLGQWEQVLLGKDARGEDDRGNYPAHTINWYDAMEFCRKLTDQEREAGRLPRGWEYTLPTEAQWEYACRAGTTTAYSFGDDSAQLGDYAWMTISAPDRAALVGKAYDHPGGLKKPNAWGLYDMYGNVGEWCQDWFDKELSGGTDPRGPARGTERVNRGGSWGVGRAEWARSAARSSGNPSQRGGGEGFRVALVEAERAPARAARPAPLASRFRTPVSIRPGGLAALALMEPVLKELEIEKGSPEADELRKLSEAMTKDLLERTRGRARGERENPRELGPSLRTKYDPELKKLLTPEQFIRLKQISWQQMRTDALFEPDVVEALDLKADQQERLLALRQEMFEKRVALLNPRGGRQPDREEVQKKQEELLAEQQRKIDEILSKAQQEKFAGLIGKPFDLMLLRGTRPDRGPLRRPAGQGAEEK